uniref:Uncharacterized protein n=1 Tax=Salix viminalis TaxID=40686 RepID=A0A6N2LL16_SALVM
MDSYFASQTKLPIPFQLLTSTTTRNSLTTHPSNSTSPTSTTTPPLSRSRRLPQVSHQFAARQEVNTRRCCLQTDRSRKKAGGTPSSLPVNIPDWSKILKDEYEGDLTLLMTTTTWTVMIVFDGGVRVPPHELLGRQMARTRIASFSLHEGIGRTLKGGILVGSEIQFGKNWLQD